MHGDGRLTGYLRRQIEPGSYTYYYPLKEISKIEEPSLV